MLDKEMGPIEKLIRKDLHMMVDDMCDEVGVESTRLIMHMVLRDLKRLDTMVRTGEK